MARAVATLNGEWKMFLLAACFGPEGPAFESVFLLKVRWRSKVNWFSPAANRFTELSSALGTRPVLMGFLRGLAVSFFLLSTGLLHEENGRTLVTVNSQVKNGVVLRYTLSLLSHQNGRFTLRVD